MWTCFHSNPQSHISFQPPVEGHSGRLTFSRNSSLVGQGKAFQDGREFLRLKGRSQWRGDGKAVEQGPLMGKACSGHRAFARAVPLAPCSLLWFSEWPAPPPSDPGSNATCSEKVTIAGLSFLSLFPACFLVALAPICHYFGLFLVLHTPF